MRALSSAMASLSALLLLLLLCGGHAATASVSFDLILPRSPAKQGRREREEEEASSLESSIDRGVVDRAVCISDLTQTFKLLARSLSLHQSKQVFTPEDEAAVVSSLQALDLSAM